MRSRTPAPLAALVVAVSAALSLAAAHGTTIPHDLAGVSLCVDDASVRVSFPGHGAAMVRTLVEERVERALHATFDAASLPWRRESECPAARGYVSILLEVREAEWFAPRASEYDLAVRVGPRSERGGTVRAEPPDAFDLAVTELFDERAVGVPAFVYLPGYLEAGLRDLSVSWWEDQTDALVPRWVPWVGTVLAVSSAAVTAWALRRRWRVAPTRVRIIPHEGPHPRGGGGRPPARLRPGGGAGADAPLDRR